MHKNLVFLATENFIEDLGAGWGCQRVVSQVQEGTCRDVREGSRKFARIDSPVDYFPGRLIQRREQHWNYIEECFTNSEFLRNIHS
jgi:hypothetical protein